MERHLETAPDLSDIFETAFECAARVDKQGKYLSVNKPFADLYGYSPDEMIDLDWRNNIHVDDIEMVKQAYTVMLEQGRANVELRGIRKDGTTFYKDILMFKSFHDETSLLSHYCFIQDITDKKISEKDKLSACNEIENLNIVAQTNSDSPDEDYFVNVARKLCELTRVKTVGITKCINFANTTVRMLAFYNENKTMDNIEYDIADTPCEKIIKGESNFYPENVQRLFPKDSDLVDLNAESYCAVPLLNRWQEVIGHIFIIDDKPMKNENQHITILDAFTKPVAREIERQHNETIFSNLVNAFNIRQGPRFFVDLANHMQKILKADYVIVSEILDYKLHEAKTLVIQSQGKTIDNIYFSIKGTPCEDVFEKTVISFSKNVRSHFPGAELLERFDAESYIGSPLLDNNGVAIGVISIVNSTEIKNIKTYESLVNIFAIRASDELNRIRKEQVLTRYKDLINSSSDMITTIDLDYKYISANKSHLDFFNKSEEQFIGFSPVDLFGEEYFLEQIKPQLDACFKGQSVKKEIVVTKDNDGKHYVSAIANPYYSDNNEIIGAVVIGRDITERRQTELLLELESECRHIDLSIENFDRKLEEIIKKIETYFDSLIGSITLLDESRTIRKKTISPQLPEEYYLPLLNLEIGEGRGTCGTAAFRKEIVIVSDIQTDPLWKNYKDRAAQFQLAACWAIPILSNKQEVLGTFAGYYRQKRRPSTFELELLTRVAYIISAIVVENENDEKLKDSREKIRTLYNDTPSIFFSLDKNKTIISVNEFGANSLGRKPSELIGKYAISLCHKDDKRFVEEKINACFANPGETYRWEIRQIHRAGHIIWVRQTAHVVESNNEKELLVVSEDISENRRLSEELKYQATHDPLTSLVNRREFEKRLERVLDDKVVRIPGHAVCYLDLDNFKLINDTCGHLAGDAMLKQLTALLSAAVRGRDTLARLGGDEFGILIENCSLRQAKSVARKILAIVEDFKFIWGENKFTVGVSIGLVPINDSSGSVVDILSAADNACYVAKESGRNRIHVFLPDDGELEKRKGEMQWVTRINHALEEDLFCLFYQDVAPCVVPDKPGKKRFEILVRIKTYDGEHILPGAFLPAAERYNQSIKIDQWVIDASLNWLSSNEYILDSIESCAINISGHSISNEKFLNYCLEKIECSNVAAHKVCFEITETAAIANLASARKFMSELNRKGCTFALDDFGSGLSSFGYLKNLPVDYIKIDGVFVRDLLTDPVDYEMVSAINRLGHTMDKKIIAEFVENKEILNMLNDIGVDYAQGYGIGKPKPIENFTLE